LFSRMLLISLFFLFFGLVFKQWCVSFVLVVVLSNTFVIVFVLVLYCRGSQVMSIVLYFEVLVFVFGEFFVLFCVPFFFMLLFSGLWIVDSFLLLSFLYPLFFCLFCLNFPPLFWSFLILCGGV
jgi:hypothetical protein